LGGGGVTQIQADPLNGKGQVMWNEKKKNTPGVNRSEEIHGESKSKNEMRKKSKKHTGS